MFSLEQLSKIKNAKEDNNILNFFGVLDESIGNESLTLAEHAVSFSELRDDAVKQFPGVELIKKNFPDREGDYLKVPKVV